MNVNGEGDVDNEEKYFLLVEYKDCGLPPEQIQERQCSFRKIRESLKELLLEELRERFVENIEDEPAEIGEHEENYCNLGINDILSETTVSIAIKLSCYQKAIWKSLFLID